ncbi:MAG: hypothetical protein LBP75_11895, partial [Planctomycetota bacterium]|nr:hypothetical protein [Planctomycetota bacterium]
MTEFDSQIRREAAERNSPAQRKIGGFDFPAGWVSVAGKYRRSVRAMEISGIALAGRVFVGNRFSPARCAGLLR